MVPASRTSRRGFLTVGALSGVGLTLADYFRFSEARGEQKSFDSIEPKAKSVIQIFLPGGIAHQESFDPKPYAPIEYRGELNAIDTAIPGEKFCETLPETAKIADKLCVIRSMTHGEAAHERGTHNMFTGYKPSPALIFPSMGSVVSHEYGPRNNLPPYVCIPNQPNEFAGTGYLSSAFAPFSLGGDPAAGGFKVRDLSLAEGVDEARFSRRRSALEAVNEYFMKKEQSDALTAMDTFYDRAYSLISSPQAREAFNIDAEPAAVRDEYGRNEAGQRMLMARRLVAAGAALCFAHLWRLGFARGHYGWNEKPDAQTSIGHMPRSFAIWIAMACLTKRSSWFPASSVARPKSTRTQAATIGRRSLAL